jgi:DNA-binding GntR family transcriptional regulator
MQKLSAPQNLTALAYQSIKKHILAGDFDAEVRLTEESLSQQLGISKSPIREALNGLEHEGLISIEPRRGAYLRQFSAKEVEDLYNLREVLEIYAVSTATITPELLRALKESIKRTSLLLKADDRSGHIEEDARFHGLIAEAAGNRELARTLDKIQNQIWLFRCKTYDLSSSTAPRAHTAILKALEDGDRRKAQAAMREHISHVRLRLLDYMKRDDR